LSEGQSLLKETVDKLRQSQEENDLLAKRKDELETRVTGLEAEYEELLGTPHPPFLLAECELSLHTEKTIQDEETNNSEAIADLRVSYFSQPDPWIQFAKRRQQNKLEAQYNAKREAQSNEVADLKQQLELRNNEIRNLNASIDSLKGVNEELKVGGVAIKMLNWQTDRASIRRGLSRSPRLESKGARTWLKAHKI
jgi:kinesin family member 5